ncbi:hypothetical protein ES703_83473 [subsurface metagenome]
MSSWNVLDTLKLITTGVVDGVMIPPLEPAVDGKVQADSKMRMEAGPKPRLIDALYKTGYKERFKTEGDKLKLVAVKDFVINEVATLFDAAEVMRCGKDLFVHYGITTNLKGIEWIRRHFPNHRVYALNFTDDPYPIHIDATLVSLLPGLVINNPFRTLPKEHRKIFEINDWEIVDCAVPAHEKPPPLCYSSVWLSMNCLVIDPKTVCVEASEAHQAEQMDKLGFEVISTLILIFLLFRQENLFNRECGLSTVGFPSGMPIHLEVASIVQQTMFTEKVTCRITFQSRWKDFKEKHRTIYRNFKGCHGWTTFVMKKTICIILRRKLWPGRILLLSVQQEEIFTILTHISKIMRIIA